VYTLLSEKIDEAIASEYWDVPIRPNVYGTSGPLFGGVMNQNFLTVCPIPTA
jgi:hypothetical protein